MTLKNTLKRVYAVMMLLSVTGWYSVQAQVKIGDNPTSILGGSLLELESTDKALTLPRLTTTQMNAISGPIDGMVIFNTTDSSLYQRAKGAWTCLGCASGGSSPWYNMATSTASQTLTDQLYHMGSVNVGPCMSSGTYSLSVGDNSAAAGNYSMAIGKNDSAIGTGNGAWAIGYNVKARGDRSVALGMNTVASGANSTAAGNTTTASGANSTVMGFGSTASGLQSVSIGNSTNASGTNSLALGVNSDATGEGSVSIGFATNAEGKYSVSLGDDNYSVGQRSGTWGHTIQQPVPEAVPGPSGMPVMRLETGPLHLETTLRQPEISVQPSVGQTWQAGCTVWLRVKVPRPQEVPPPLQDRVPLPAEVTVPPWGTTPPQVPQVQPPLGGETWQAVPTVPPLVTTPQPGTPIVLPWAVIFPPQPLASLSHGFQEDIFSNQTQPGQQV